MLIFTHWQLAFMTVAILLAYELALLWVQQTLLQCSSEPCPRRQGARPVQAALSSAASFAVGAALPLGVTALAAGPNLMAWITAMSLAFLALLGVLAAKAGGASVWTSAWRVTFWGALAMAITAGVGSLFGAVV